MEYELLDTGRVRRRTATSTSTSSTPRPTPEDIAVPHHRAQPRGREPRRCTCCRRCGSATRGRGPPRGPAPGARQSTARTRRSRRRARTSSATSAARRARRRAAVHRERDEQRSASVGQAERDAVREGRHQRLRRARAHRRRQPRRRPARRRRRTYGSTVPGGEQATVLAAAAPRRAAERSASRSPTSTASFATRRGRGRRVLRLDHAAGRRRRRASGDAPGAGRHALAQAALLLRPRHLAARAPAPPAARADAPGRAQRVVVPHGQRRRDLDARQVGVPVVRGVGPGVPHASRWRWSTPTSPRASCDSCCRELYLHPSGQMPAYEWNFGDVNPPVHALATLFVHGIEARARGDVRPRLPDGARSASCS